MRFGIFLVYISTFLAVTYYMEEQLVGFERLVYLLSLGILTMLALLAYVLVDIADSVKNLRYNK